MGLYNIMNTGEHSLNEALIINLQGFIPIFILGFICDWFIVSKPAKKLAFRFIKPNQQPFETIVIVSLFMVMGMVLCMSFYGAITHVGLTWALPGAYLKAILLNLIVALPLQLLIAGPIVRLVFKNVLKVKNA